MSGLAGSGLTPEQSAQLARWLPAPAVVADLSWGLATTVLRIRAGGREYIVKAGGPENHHIGREITAFESYGAALPGIAGRRRLVAADRPLGLLVLDYLAGALVEGTAHELSPDAHEQAGRLLRRLHDQAAVPDDGFPDDGFEARDTAKAIARLDGAHRIEPAAERQARAILRAYRAPAAVAVPTHGDWQPRNWLIDGGIVSAIDLGRFDLRPAATDLCRLAVQQWRAEPALEAAFLRGYGPDPRDPLAWPVQLLREAIGTASWAYQVGDAAFEAQGHRMLGEALSLF